MYKGNKSADIWPCPPKEPGGTKQFWCGLASGTVCEGTVRGESLKFAVDVDDFHITSVVGGLANTTSTSPANSTTTLQPAATDNAKKGGPAALISGLSVGLPLAALAVGLGAWAFMERRERLLLTKSQVKIEAEASPEGSLISHERLRQTPELVSPPFSP